MKGKDVPLTQPSHVPGPCLPRIKKSIRVFGLQPTYSHDDVFPKQGMSVIPASMSAIKPTDLVVSEQMTTSADPSGNQDTTGVQRNKDSLK